MTTLKYSCIALIFMNKISFLDFLKPLLTNWNLSRRWELRNRVRKYEILPMACNLRPLICHSLGLRWKSSLAWGHTSEVSKNTSGISYLKLAETNCEAEIMGENLRSTRDQEETNSILGKAKIYTKKDVWYYTCPNGKKVGPFRYRSEAKSSLDQFMDQLKKRIR